MTEHQITPASEETTPAAAPLKAEKKPPRQPKNRSNAVAFVAIAIAVAVGAGLYISTKQQFDRQRLANQALTDRLTELQQQASRDQKTLAEQLADQNRALDAAQQQQAATHQQLDELKHNVATITNNDAQNWQLSQADYLVKLAERKLWSDRDVTTAVALLKTADASLAKMNDPSVIVVRRALMQDISNLAEINQTDYDGIILKLNQLANSVDNLRIADHDEDNAPMDVDSSELSSSLREWRHNLVKSWHKFMDDFITIRRRDTTAEPLLAPNQDVYLRENIRSRLLIAAQAVPRHQDEIYKQSIDTVAAWARAWFDNNDPATKALLSQLDELNQQSIAMDVPASLTSQPLLDKLVETRVRSLLAQPGVAGQQRQGE